MLPLRTHTRVHSCSGLLGHFRSCPYVSTGLDFLTHDMAATATLIVTIATAWVRRVVVVAAGLEVLASAGLDLDVDWIGTTATGRGTATASALARVGGAAVVATGFESRNVGAGRVEDGLNVG